MNKSAFLKLIQQVSGITDQQNEELEKVAATFPYCQTAHLLLAKSAYDKGSMLSTQRLRRASSYATDRQLLKRVIYTSPVPVPEFAAVELPEAAHTEEVNAVAEAVLEQEPQVREALPEPMPETPSAPEEETLEEVYTPAAAPADTLAPADASGIAETSEEEEEMPAGELDSELALLFTFSSISPSSTDLLSEKPGAEEPAEENNLAAPPANHFAETAEALSAMEEPETASAGAPFAETIGEPVEPAHTEEAHALEKDHLPATMEETPAAAAQRPNLLFAEEETSDAFFAEEDELPAAMEPADAEINYATDEIDRLYAEDALGYWMGSSRLGEVLQLKDDYTRPRPQGFHPELILEYSKTHELEKAIQPDNNILSNQIDIIDQFLKLNPRLKTMASVKLKPEPQEDLSLKSSKIKKGMASESLATIFLQQGKAKKAIKIYEQLILKYPEKKSYFAEQIEKLQNVT